MLTTPTTSNFTIYKYNTLSLAFKWQDANGNAINLTGYSALLEARYNITDSAPFLTLQSPVNITLGSDGSIVITAPPSMTSPLTAGAGVYDLQLTDTLGNVFTLLQGSVIVQEMVTR